MSFLNVTLTGGLFILAIALLRALTLRRLPKQTFVALWWAAALRLLLPVRLPSRFSVYTLLAALRPEAAPAVSAAPAASAAAPVQVLIVPGQPAALQPAPAPFPVWAALWIAGAALAALLFLIRYVRWRGRFRESLPADCPGLDTWLCLRRRIQIRVTDRIAAPLTYGLARPVILLPRTLDLKDEEAVTCVMAHELTHIRHLDGLLKLVLTAALCVHWFNPAAWILYVLGNRDMELRCDEAAVLALGEDSRERYALALIRLEEKRYVPLCGFSHKSGMEERIRAIMSIKKKSLLVCLTALALALGVTTAFATSARPLEADEPRNEDMADRELHAQFSAEAAAQWKEVLAPYEPFGLKWTFDDPDLDGNGLTMTWEGHEVSGICDEKQGLWITEHAGNSAFGPGAVELYVVYEGDERVGLRLATEEEQAAWTETRESAALEALEALGESIRWEDGDIISFTIPGTDRHWGIFISGRIATEDGAGLSVRYLEDVEEWIGGQTYSFKTADAAYDELTLSAACDGAQWEYFDLTALLPGDREPLDLKLPEEKGDVPEGVSMIWPVDGGRVTNGFGDRANPGGQGVTRHSGVDIGGLEQGTPVYASGSGTVEDTGFDAVLGNYVRLAHGSGVETLYAHCRSVEVRAGDAVEMGRTIATVGSTGQSTGPHLHFELLVNGVSADPMAYMNQNPAAQDGPEETGGGASPEDREKMEAAGEPTARDLADGDYPRNSRGETYGAAYYSQELGEPDLIAAVNEEGTKGYISREDMNIEVSGSPEEIIACANWKEENHVTGFTIPLYDQDHNVIGEFQVGEGGSGSKTFEEMKAAKAQGWPNSKGSEIVQKESAFDSMEEAREAAINGWVGDSNSGYYIEQ